MGLFLEGSGPTGAEARTQLCRVDHTQFVEPCNHVCIHVRTEEPVKRNAASECRSSEKLLCEECLHSVRLEGWQPRVDVQQGGWWSFGVQCRQGVQSRRCLLYVPATESSLGHHV